MTVCQMTITRVCLKIQFMQEAINMSQRIKFDFGKDNSYVTEHPALL